MPTDKIFLLDASAIVALIDGEYGVKILEKVVATGNAKATPIALAEAMGTLRRGAKLQAQDVLETVTSLGIEIVSLEEEDALEMDSIKEMAEAEAKLHKGRNQLSMADASCLAVGRRLGANVVFSDSYWEILELEDVAIFPFR